MDPDASVWKFVLIYLVWLLASVAIALIGGLLVGAVASLLGVDAKSVLHQRIVEVAAVLGFTLLAAVPFYVRRRMASGEV
ncbi:MAG: hypothetical protein ABFS21_06845 [Actinomycetota bacterium]